MDGIMNQEVNGMPFSEIMSQAVKLKTHQVLYIIFERHFYNGQKNGPRSSFLDALYYQLTRVYARRIG
jgi:hypothetical protein